MTYSNVNHFRLIWNTALLYTLYEEVALAAGSSFYDDLLPQELNCNIVLQQKTILCYALFCNWTNAF